MKKNKLFLTLPALCVLHAPAQKQEPVNALHHALQQRPATERLDSARFADHTFFSLSAGIESILNRARPLASDDWGVTTSLSYGKWFNAVSGARIGISATAMAPTAVRGRTLRPLVGMLSADYLVDLSALGWGYRPDRVFSVIGLAGGGLHYSTSNGSGDFGYSLHAGMQANFRLTSYASFFVEPRFTFYTDNVDQQSTWRGYNVAPALLAGITYRMTPLATRNGASEARLAATEGIFVTAGLGTSLLLTRTPGSWYNELGVQLTAGLGKWFTPVHGARISAQLGEYNIRGKERTVAMVQADYLTNLNALFGGHHPSELLRLHLVSGLEGALLRGNTAVGAGVGIQANMRLSSQFSLYLEPRVSLFSRGLAGGTILGNRIDVLTRMNAGLSYTLRPYDAAGYRARFEENRFANYFLTMSAGLGTMVNRHPSLWEFGPTARVSLGNRYSPLSSWRVSGRLEMLPELFRRGTRKYDNYAGIDADYLFNLSTAAAGYNPDRIVTLRAVAGVSAGISYSRHALRFVPGIHGGGEADFRLSPALSLTVEPRISLYGKNYERYGYRNYDVTSEVLAGLTYRFKNMGDGNRGETPERPYFVTAAMGTGMYATAFLGRKFGEMLTLSSEAGAGMWFNALSGVRATVSTTQVDRSRSKALRRYDLNLVGLHADYLLNLSILFGGDPEGRFRLIGIAGVGGDLGFQDSYSATGVAVSGTLGLQADTRVSERFSVFAEGRGTIFGDRIDRRESGVNLDGAAVLMVGTTYSF